MNAQCQRYQTCNSAIHLLSSESLYFRARHAATQAWLTVSFFIRQSRGESWCYPEDSERVAGKYTLDETPIKCRALHYTTHTRTHSHLLQEPFRATSLPFWTARGTWGAGTEWDLGEHAQKHRTGSNPSLGSNRGAVRLKELLLQERAELLSHVCCHIDKNTLCVRVKSHNAA